MERKRASSQKLGDKCDPPRKLVKKTQPQTVVGTAAELLAITARKIRQSELQKQAELKKAKAEQKGNKVEQKLEK